jgi:hypothetical protein
MSFEVVVDDLRAHASHLDGFADRLSTALSAATTVSMSDDAYGLLCSFLPPIVNPMEQEGMDTLNAAHEAVSTTAGNVRTAATSYEDSDAARAQSLEGILATDSTAPTAMRQGDAADW